MLESLVGRLGLPKKLFSHTTRVLDFEEMSEFECKLDVVACIGYS